MVVHSNSVPAPSQRGAVMDIFRIDNGKIVEQIAFGPPHHYFATRATQTRDRATGSANSRLPLIVWALEQPGVWVRQFEGTKFCAGPCVAGHATTAAHVPGSRESRVAFIHNIDLPDSKAVGSTTPVRRLGRKRRGA